MFILKNHNLVDALDWASGCDGNVMTPVALRARPNPFGHGQILGLDNVNLDQESVSPRFGAAEGPFDLQLYLLCAA